MSVGLTAATAGSCIFLVRDLLGWLQAQNVQPALPSSMSRLLAQSSAQNITASQPFFSLDPAFLLPLQTWLRVLGGLHSPAQVVVGALIGFVDAYTWKASFELFQRAIARGSLSAHAFNSLLVASFIATLCFAVWREVDAKKAKAPP